METRKQTLFGFNLWLFDLAVTAVSFVAAYRLRALLPFRIHLLLPIENYLWLLGVMALALAALLPVFRVYAALEWPSLRQFLRLSGGFALAALVLLVLPFLQSNYASNRVLVVIMLAINYALLVAYRFVVFRVRGIGGRGSFGDSLRIHGE